MIETAERKAHFLRVRFPDLWLYNVAEKHLFEHIFQLVHVIISTFSVSVGHDHRQHERSG